MKLYLEDLHEAEANVIRTKNEFLTERGWAEDNLSWKKHSGLLWSKVFKRSEMHNWTASMGDLSVTTAEAKYLTTDEAIDLEITYGSKNLHKYD